MNLTAEESIPQRQTPQQKRAAYAMRTVRDQIQPLQPGDRDRYKALAAALPAMILMNGLGQAAAYYLTKSELSRSLYRLLSTWLTEAEQPYADKPDLMEGIVGNDMQRYRLAQVESLALLDWVKKFANAYARGEE